MHPQAVELPQRRNWNAKHYQNPDATLSAVISTGSMHYKATINGAWLDKHQRLRAGSGVNEWISDESDVTMRTYQVGQGGNARWWVEFKETLTGLGIAFQLQFQPTTSAGSNVLSFLDGSGGIWTYTHTRTGGKMLGPSTPVSVGTRTYTFTYQLLGGAPPLSVQSDGSIACGNLFRMEAPHLVGADGIRYSYSDWQVDGVASALTFSYADTSLPPAAYPYRVDPSTSFSVTAGANDNYVFLTQASVFPPTGTASAANTAADIYAAKELFSSPTYQIGLSGFAWDTSSLSGTTVTSALARLLIRGVANANSKSVTMDYYTWNNTASDYAATAGTDAHAGTTVASLTVGADNDFALLNPGANISTTGSTYLRAHLSDGATPTGRNYVWIEAYEGTLAEPRIVVDYVLSANAYIQLGSDGLGKKLRTQSFLI